MLTLSLFDLTSLATARRTRPAGSAMASCGGAAAPVAVLLFHSMNFLTSESYLIRVSEYQSRCFKAFP